MLVKNMVKIPSIDNDNVKIDIIGDCVISKLENLPRNLRELWIDGYNQISKLESLPERLKIIQINGYNKISKLEYIYQRL